MTFTLSLAMTPPTELLPLARAGEAAGWDAIALPDSVFYPEGVSGDYPFTADGERFWDADTPFTDPFVAMPAIAAVTERVELYTNVYKIVLRQPLLVAKMLGSLAAMFEGRIGLGVGVSWMPEEFTWLASEMRTRGKRLDEIIDILRVTLAPGWAEYHGEHYEFDRLKMSPVPTRPVPIYVGGHSDAALGRAATRGDGWIGANVARDDIAELVTRLHRALDATGRDPNGFEVKLTPLVRDTADAMGEVLDAGVTDIITVPWMYAGFGPQPLEAKVESVERFATDVIAPLRAR
ncbi:MAG: TIGR03619 family F420-dependent LLM class oxidoreductase [Actinobacteria bacterium]|nr:TIGR03619 family F420-dependent LLM class oxidoreductase [Actinomycetota bacterium]